MSKELPLVSIITPAYNAGQYMKETIESALEQIYTNFEHIIVDDGSTDNTSEIVHSFKDTRIKYVFQENQGQSAARNTAIAMASGKYIALLDADDIFYSDKLKNQVEYMERHPDCEFCYCKVHHFYDKKPNNRYYFSMRHPSGYIFDQLVATNFINPLSVVLRREVFIKHGAFQPKFRWADEQYAWLQLAYKQVKFCYLDKALGAFRLHPESFTNRPPYLYESQKECVEILHLLRSWMSEEEVKKYKMDELEARTRRRIKIGKMMVGKNLFAKLLHYLYILNRRRRLKKVPFSEYSK